MAKKQSKKLVKKSLTEIIKITKAQPLKTKKNKRR